MKKLLLMILLSFTVTAAIAADFYVSGRVKSAVNKLDLTKAVVIFYDGQGNVSDSVRANQGYRFTNNELDTMSYFYKRIPRADTTLVFDVKCDGFNTLSMTYRVDNIGKRERGREMPLILLERAPRMLKEVTVTSTKIKFYNKGDTVVYNADAFNLAEGSMLDALVSQLPGAELSTDGQIKVNGEFVESLLLNGKEFMDGNNNVMLENIAAYTVKDIQVYQGQKLEDQRQGKVMAPKVLTMNVQLKKEYDMGLMINAQGGYGTDDRYMGRLFASWFNSTTNISLIGNANNLNDKRTPGRNDTWTPEQMPSGRTRNYMGGLNYNYDKPDESFRASGNFMIQRTLADTYSDRSKTNFLPGGDTYEKTFGQRDRHETKVVTRHYVSFQHKKKLGYGVSLNGDYSRIRNVNSTLGGAFDTEQADLTMAMLDAIYSDGSAGALESIINRSKTRSDGFTRKYYGSISPYLSFELPKSGDRIGMYVSMSYNSVKDEAWHDYEVNYGDNPDPAVRRRRFTDNTPNHEFSLWSVLNYSTKIGNAWLGLDYNYEFEDEVKDSYMYALEHLEDMGVYGVLPSGYLATLDAGNSYKSHTFTNTHSLRPQMQYRLQKDNRYLEIYLMPNLSFKHRKLIYWRDNRDFSLSTQNTMYRVQSIWASMIEAGFGKHKEGRGYRHTLRYSFRVEPKLADMVDMLDVVSDSDPLNIYVGNPDLKTQTRFNHLLRWSYSPESHTLKNILYLGFIHTDNTLVRGYTYDTSTGVRVNRMYNVNGDRRAAITNELSWQFGKKKQFTISTTSDASIERLNDMIGVDAEVPEKYTVKQRVLTQNVKFQYEIAKQTVSLRFDYTNRHTTSAQPGFSNLNANHLNYGVSGVFRLPAGFGISTDFLCYTRRGYGSSALDTTDPVWNARLSFTPTGNKHWTVMLDGFDLLHKLSNVNYAVSASGRTVTFTNTLPRYVMLSVQYRLNIQPRKR